jgi:hypothetical protein
MTGALLINTVTIKKRMMYKGRFFNLVNIVQSFYRHIFCNQSITGRLIDCKKSVCKMIAKYLPD